MARPSGQDSTMEKLEWIKRKKRRTKGRMALLKRKSQLVLHDYLIFHRVGNCPPNNIMANSLTPHHQKKPSGDVVSQGGICHGTNKSRETPSG